MKRFLSQFLYFIPIPIIVMGVNYFVDPANIFQNGNYEYSISKYLIQGYNVTNVTNYDERLLQKYFIQQMKNCPHEVVLGSSRIMMIGGNDSAEAKLINNGVSGATLEDDLAIYYLYEKKGCKIEKVIIGLDPYLLNDNHGQIRWRSLENEYNEFIVKLGLHPEANTVELTYIKYEELLSVSYFKNSLDNLIHGVNKKILPTKDNLNDKFTRLYDGSISYGAEFRNNPPTKVSELALDTLKINYSMDDFTVLSKRYKEIFSRFIDYLQTKNIEVEFILSPFHPLVYNVYTSDSHYLMVNSSENFYKEFAKSRKIKVFGSFNPNKYHIDNLDFYDGQHSRPIAMKIIMNQSVE
jgi:hypothetical protein